MKLKFRLLLLPTLIAGASSLAFSDTLLNVDFEAGNVGTSTTFDGGQPNSGGVPILTVNNLDTGNIFGQGTGNTYATFVDNTDQGRKAAIFEFAPSTNLALTLTANVYVHSNPFIGGASLGFYTGAQGSNPDPANRVAAASLSVNSGVPLETLVQVHLFYNGTEDILTYWDPVEGLIQDLNPGGNAVAFAHNTVANTWTKLLFREANASTDPITRIAFTSDINADVTVLSFDDLRVEDGLISVPEPSTYALIGGLAALGLVVLRRRKTK